MTETYGREGMVFDGEVVKCSRDRLTMEFDNGKVAYFDFSDPAQYHSFIRTRQLTMQEATAISSSLNLALTKGVRNKNSSPSITA